MRGALPHRPSFSRREKGGNPSPFGRGRVYDPPNGQMYETLSLRERVRVREVF
jgi:hypothetical protein